MEVDTNKLKAICQLTYKCGKINTLFISEIDSEVSFETIATTILADIKNSFMIKVYDRFLELKEVHYKKNLEIKAI